MQYSIENCITKKVLCYYYVVVVTVVIVKQNMMTFFFVLQYVCRLEFVTGCLSSLPFVVLLSNTNKNMYDTITIFGIDLPCN